MWRGLIALALTGLSLNTAQAQTTEQEEVKPQYVVDTRTTPNEVHDVAEVMPSFGNTANALHKYLMQHIKYPKAADKRDEQGRVVVEFIVERNGKISNIKVVRSVSPALDKEAVRVIRRMPRWNPGKKDGKTIRTRFVLPIHFRLQ